MHPAYWCTYNTFAHIAPTQICVRGVRSAPGDLSLMRHTEADDDTVVAEQTASTLSRAEQHYRARNRKRTQAASLREAAAIAAAAAEPQPLPPPLEHGLYHLWVLLRKQLEDRSRVQALKRLRQTCLHIVPPHSHYTATAAKC